MAEFNVGDEVAVIGWRGTRRILPVKRVMARFVELSDCTKWTLDGFEYPRSKVMFESEHIELATPEHREALAKRARVRLLLEAWQRVNGAIIGDKLVSGVADIEAATAALAKLEVKA